MISIVQAMEGSGREAGPSADGRREAAVRYDFDVIVVGGGAGGATFAYACARAGKSVLVLERGEPLSTEGRCLDERAALIDKGPYDDRKIDVNGISSRLYMPGILGGGTSVYGGALIRPSEQDFQPGRYYGKRIPGAIWEWPISYSDLEPHYTEAERLYGVAGCGEEDFGPLQKPSRGFSREPLPLHPLNQRLITANRHHGLHPFRLPLAIDSSQCLRCGVCAGYVCPTGARSSAPPICSIRRRPGAMPSRSRPRSKWSDWSRNAAAGQRRSACSTAPAGRRSTTRADAMRWRRGHRIATPPAAVRARRTR